MFPFGQQFVGSSSTTTSTTNTTTINTNTNTSTATEHEMDATSMEVAASAHQSSAQGPSPVLHQGSFASLMDGSSLDVLYVVQNRDHGTRAGEVLGTAATVDALPASSAVSAAALAHAPAALSRDLV